MCIENVANIITMLATCILAYVAIRGLGEWKKQMLGKYTYDLFSRIDQDIYNFKKSMGFLRSSEPIRITIYQNYNNITEIEHQNYLQIRRYTYSKLLSDTHMYLDNLLNSRPEFSRLINNTEAEKFSIILEEIRRQVLILGKKIEEQVFCYEQIEILVKEKGLGSHEKIRELEKEKQELRDFIEGKYIDTPADFQGDVFGKELNESLNKLEFYLEKYHAKK